MGALGAYEERARFELGMIKEDEVFVQVVEAGDERSRSIPRSPDPNAPDQARPIPTPTPTPQAHLLPQTTQPQKAKPKSKPTH